MKDKELVFGYGSIMSLHGLFRILRSENQGARERIRVYDIKIIHLLEGKRGFAKPTRRGDLAMDLDYFRLEGKYVPPRYRPDRGIVGIGIVVSRHDFRKICKREGYHECSKLIKKAEAKNMSVGEYLYKLAEEVSSDGILNICNVGGYREILSREIRGSNADHRSSIGYIPHPLVLNDNIAIVFIAAGTYGTGTGEKSRKEEEGIKKVMSVYDYYLFLRKIGRDYKNFKRYLVECLLGGVYGINLEDLTKSLKCLSIEEPSLVSTVRKMVERYIHKEIELAVEHVLNGNRERFYRVFGALEENIRHAGLASIGIKIPKHSYNKNTIDLEG